EETPDRALRSARRYELRARPRRCEPGPGAQATHAPRRVAARRAGRDLVRRTRSRGHGDAGGAPRARLRDGRRARGLERLVGLRVPVRGVPEVRVSSSALSVPRTELLPVDAELPHTSTQRVRIDPEDPRGPLL